MDKYYIAIGDRLNTTQWRNVQLSWTEIVERCKKPKITHETAEQYKAMSKDKKTRLKDAGGFVGGYLKEGKRSRANVEFRSLVTLDLDNANKDSWNDFTLTYNYTCLCYSTHSHTEDHPRLRYVFALSRNVTPDEYPAIARYVAKLVGIEQMDKTTYDLERLFFWPSMPKDVDYVFEHQEGEVLDVDYILKHEYHNWRDTSEWPMSKDEVTISLPSNVPPQDPTTKQGTIGAFCRCYNIVSAIETFLSTIYVPGTKGRYTYARGTSFNGLTISKDGNFAYSHHATDPAYVHHWLNAFDLVRIHLFSEKDPIDFPEDKTLPSYKAMLDFAEEEEQTKLLIQKERRESLKDDFKDIEDADIEDTDIEDADTTEDFTWEAKLEKKGKQILSTPYNVKLILENHPAFKGKIYLNLFAENIGVRGGLPWDDEAKVWKSDDNSCFRNFLSDEYGIKSKEIVKDALTEVTKKHRIHPIKAYLNSLKWDGTPRLDTVLTDYLGAEDNELNRAMIHKHLVAAVKRIFVPGCKYDYCLILAGPEGVGKSTLLRILASDEWFSDSVTTMEGKEGMEAVTGCWLIEMPELVSQKRSTVESVKAFITKTEDKYRAAYAELKDPRPRQCVFCGTTNEDKFLKGDTGNRRFWIVHTPGLKVPFNETSEVLQSNRDQIWAEAVHYYRKGEKLFLPSELEAQARKRQEKYNELSDDTLASSVDVFLETRIPKKWRELTRKQRHDFYAEAGIPVPDGKLSLQPVGTEIRKTMCAREFIEEFLNPTYTDTKDKYLAGKVNRIMRRKTDWFEEGPRLVDSQYGMQRRFRRKMETSNQGTLDKSGVPDNQGTLDNYGVPDNQGTRDDKSDDNEIL